MEDTPLRPDRLVELANAFRGAKALMSSVELRGLRRTRWIGAVRR